MKRLFPLWLLLIGCNQNTINTPIRSFDRPSDVALQCAQRNPNDLTVIDVRPITDCTVERTFALAFVGYDGATHYPGLRALVANSARGEVALVEAQGGGGLVDLYPRNPGFGFLPVGKLPEHVRVSSDGCKAVTTNLDSCDLSFIDSAELQNLRTAEAGIDGGFPDGSVFNDPKYGDDVVRRMVPTVNGKPLGARPTWIEFAPESTPGIRGYETAKGGIPGTCRGGSYSAWVALPGCQLVVKVSLTNTVMDGALKAIPAEVTAAMRVLRDKVELVTDLSTLSCAAECSGGAPFVPADLGPPADMAGSDGGAGRLPDTQAFPGTFAIDLDRDKEGQPLGPGRLVVADQFGERLSVVTLDPSTGKVDAPRSIQLEAGALGVQVVRISPRTPAGKFLYAVGRDGAVRVVDMDREVECETNPDPRELGSEPPGDPFPAARRLGCFPLGDPSTPKRSPLVQTPGILLQNGALPKDIAFVHVDAAPPPADGRLPAAQPGLLAGDFAWIVASDGRAALVNIFDACPAPNDPVDNSSGTASYTHTCSLDNVARSRSEALKLPGRPQAREYERVSHRLRQARNRFFPVGCGDAAGSPRLPDESNPFALTVSGMGVESGRPNAEGVATIYPTLVKEVLPVIPAAACPNNRTVGFHEIDRVRNERWALSWEGLLPGTQRALGRPRFEDPTYRLYDAGAVFCHRGVRKGDILVLNGCTQDADCDFAQTCKRDPGAPATITSGMCLDRDDPVQADQCSPLLRAVRNFRITSARQGVVQAGTGELSDVLEFDEIAQPEHLAEYTVAGSSTCTTNADCAMVTIDTKDSAGNPLKLPTTCAPVGAGVMRCVRTCIPAPPGAGTQPENRCGGEFQCARSRYGDTRCLRAPLDPKFFLPRSQGGFGCVRELQSYQVQAGESFIVAGATTGYLVTAQANPVTKECEAPPLSEPFVRLRQPRIPIDNLPACGVTTNVREPIVPTGAPESNVCFYGESPSRGRIIHYENPFFAFGLELPPGQPVPPDRFALTFDIVGGGFPLTSQLAVDTIAQQPRAAVTSPDGQFVFVVDEGKSNSAAGLRGQLLRLNSLTQAVDRSFVVR
jgi:hypothetical protein